MMAEKKPAQQGSAGFLGNLGKLWEANWSPDRIHTPTPEGLSGEILEKYAPTGAPKNRCRGLYRCDSFRSISADRAALITC